MHVSLWLCLPLSITGINNYSGTVSKTFNILPAPIPPSDNDNGNGAGSGSDPNADSGTGGNQGSDQGTDGGTQSSDQGGNRDSKAGSGGSSSLEAHGITGEDIQAIEGLDNVSYGHETGNVLSDGNFIYVVTKTASDKGAGELSVAGLKKKTSKKIRISASATIDGIVYNITAIRSNAFKKNKTITSISAGKNITDIGTGAFEGCSKLKKVTLNSKSLKSIGKKAFKSCKKLKSLSIKSTKLKKIGRQAFKNTPAKIKINVPKAKKSAYKKLLKNGGYKGTVK